MQLTGSEAVARGIVAGHDPKRIRPASCDLTVGRVLIGGNEHRSAIMIPSQRTFIIESLETVEVPVGYVGHALPKTSLCNDGILVLNTGLVDPGFRGRLSTIAINFSSGSQRLTRGDVFLRFALFRLEGAGSDELDKTLSAYEDPDAARERSRNYPECFLDVPGQADRLVREAAADIARQQRNFVLMLIAIIGIVFSGWNLGAYVVLSRQANVVADRTVQAEIKAVELADLKAKVETLQARLDRSGTDLPSGRARR